MATVFISYSRKDMAFAKRLTEEFRQRGLEFWVDWEGIPPTVDWWREIQNGIENADAYIFLISPDAVQSQINLRELDHAVRNGKRIIPILVRDIEGSKAPPEISSLNWIFIREADDFAAGVEAVMTMVNTDHEWIQAHRQLQVKALEWERKRKDSSFLLRGTALTEAEAQLARNASREPHPTELQRDYVSASRRNLSIFSRGVEAVSNAIGGGRSEQSEKISQSEVKQDAEAGEKLRRNAFGGDIVRLTTSNQLTYENRTKLQSLPSVRGPFKMMGEREFEVVVDNATTAVPDLVEALTALQLTVETIQKVSPPVVRVKVSPKIREETPPYLEDLPFVRGKIILLNDQEMEVFVDDANTAIPDLTKALREAKYRVQTIGQIAPSVKDMFVRSDQKENTNEPISEPSPDQAATATNALHPDKGEDEAERAMHLQAAKDANLLANNRSQPVYNDRAQGEDQLGIKDEVEALAETLLLRDVEPPIAVGVMGGWGSGKSFVMYLISKYVEQTRCKIVKRGWSTQDKDPDVPAYVGHVYQINFNAWTYAKSNLWASLMDTIFINLNRQMQIEQLLAHRDCSPKDTINLAEDVRKSMLAGGKEFVKIYGESLRFDQDKELEPWKENLEYWAHHLFKGNLLWSVMRRRQEENLDRLKDTEEQLKQLKSQRDQFEKSRSPEKKNINLDPASAKACAQTMLTALAAFIPEQVGKTAVQTLEQQNVTEEDIRQALKDTWEVKGLIDTVFGMFREYKFLRLLTLLFLLLGIILWTFPLPNVDFIQGRMVAVASFIATALPFVSASLVWWQKVASFNAKAKVILEDAYKNQQAKQAEEIANSTKKSPTQKIADLQKEVSQGSIAAYDTLINLLEAQAEAERQLIGPSAKYSSLMEFVQSRLDAATYENQLGLMHQVRQDIDELTYSLADGAREDVFPRGKPRVILYIDDLDRCPPQRVVEILEAVQLLLNTKLFVIILGLDTRYVTRALEKEYKEILQHEGDPSGLDYIEKIIQIPYRVRPIERDGLQKYLAMQMDVEKLPEPEPEPVVQTAERDVPVQSTPLAEPQPRAESTASTPPAAEEPPQAPTATEPVTAADAKEPEPEQPKLPEIELPAAVIQFKHEDLLDLTACCQQIPLSPRSIKRLVNVFKLIKIFWFRADKEADLAGRDQPRPVKQAAMCMLALSSAYPEVMREVFVHLEGLYRQGKERSVLFTELNSIKLPPGSAHDLAWQLQKYKSDVSTLKMMAGNEQDKLSQLTLKDFKLSTFNIVRSFSFVGDPMYWTDGEDDASRANGKSEAKPAGRARKKQALP